jgi:predicted aldo/keto reductase-like oxidoreductase
MQRSQLPQRKFGTTGEMVSIIGFGGLILSGMPQKEADLLVGEAFGAGVNFFDVAPTYGDAELKLGPAIKSIRSKILLSCKTTCRDKQGAWKQLHESLKRIKTDYFDFYVLHGLVDPEKDAGRACGEDGTLAAALEAQKAGLVRYIGFSAHTSEAMRVAFNAYNFDLMMFPINAFCYYTSNYGEEALEVAKRHGACIVALKALAKQRWPQVANRTEYPNCWYEPITEQKLAFIALSWVYDRGIDTLIPPADIRLFRLALGIASQAAASAPTYEEIEILKKTARTVNPIFST